MFNNRIRVSKICGTKCQIIYPSYLCYLHNIGIEEAELAIEEGLDGCSVSLSADH